MLKTEQDVRDHQSGFALENVDLNTALRDEAKQPVETEAIVEIRERFTTQLAELMQKDRQKPEEEQQVLEKRALLERAYGGNTRMYERFLLARKGNMEKSTKMMKNMLKVRREILGEQLVTCATMSNNFYDFGTEEDETLFKAIDGYWAVDFWGFTKEGNPLITGKLKDIKPAKFIKNYKKDDIKRFYFLFMEKGNILNRYANSPPLRDGDLENNTSRRVVEIYDFKGMSMRQFHMSGLRVLIDVLKVGQSCFPEHVERTIFINVPWFFSASWAIVSKVLDKETNDKQIISRGNCNNIISNILGSETLVPTLFSRIEKKVSQVNDK